MNDSGAYVIGHITVKNPEKWAEYRMKVPATLAEWGLKLSFVERKLTFLVVFTNISTPLSFDSLM